MSSLRFLVVGSNGLLGQKTADLLVRGMASSVTLSSLEEVPIRPVENAEYVKADLTSRKEVKQLIAECTKPCRRLEYPEESRCPA